MAAKAAFDGAKIVRSLASESVFSRLVSISAPASTVKSAAKAVLSHVQYR